MTVWIGNSGWQYRHWRETFYPKGVPQRLWLEYYMERYRTVELNNSFYRWPPRENFVKWRARTPTDFRMVVKATRFITHIKRLKEPEPSVERMIEGLRALGDKLGPVLFQLPPSLKIDLAGLERTCEAMPRDMQMTWEFRNETWWTDEVREMLERYNAALCWADRGEKAITALWKTADWGYLRFHQGWADPVPCYKRDTLKQWAERIAETWPADADVWVYFNNDPRGCAPRDSIWFAEECQALGLEATRVPKIEEVHVDTLSE